MRQPVGYMLRGIAAIGLIAGCGTIAPESYDEGDRAVSVSLDPAVVERGQQLTVRALIQNRSDNLANYSSGSGCAYGVRIVRKGVDYTPMIPGTTNICTAAITSFPVPAQGSREFPSHLTANAPPGEYEVTVRWILQPFVREVTTKMVIR